MKLFKLTLLLVVTASNLIGCGGGVEGGGTAATVEEDTTPPVFIGGDPEGSVTQACSVTAEFDEPILKSSVTDQSFIIQKSGSTDPLASGDGTWGLASSSNAIALFTPATPLDGSYSVTITTAITNTVGLNLTENHSWTFTTAVPCPP